MEPEIITEDIKKALKEAFKELKADVPVEIYIKSGENDMFNNITVSLLKTLGDLTRKIKPSFHKVGDEMSKKRGVERSPTLLIAPDKYNIRFTGAPLGEEGRSLVMSIIMASAGKGILPEGSFGELKEKRQVKVFVSPTCPYCPQQVLYGVSAVISRPDLISLEVIEIYENKDLAERFGVASVPQTFVNDILVGHGLQPEDVFIGAVMAAGWPEFVPKEAAPGEAVERDLVIIGGGPGGLTAAIYAERAGLKTVVLEKSAIGGQVAITPVVENYPGFTRVAGKTLVDLIAQQASQYADIHQAEDVRSVKKTGGLFEVKTSRGLYTAKGLILVTGARSRTLDVPGESRLFGRGVSYCATCDGYFYKDGKRVFVVGGGNTALTDALYLHNIGAKVTLIHRRDRFRAEERLKEGLRAAKIPVFYNSVVKEVMGDKLLGAIKVEDLKTGKVGEIPADGLFVAIGYEPNNELAKALGLDLDPEGYIKTDASQRTSMPMVYAAGDVTGSVKQIAVAVGQGAVAATSAFEDIGGGMATPQRARPAATKGATSSGGGTATPQEATRPSDIGAGSTGGPWWSQP